MIAMAGQFCHRAILYNRNTVMWSKGKADEQEMKTRLCLESICRQEFCQVMSFFQLPVYMCAGSGERWGVATQSNSMRSPRFTAATPACMLVQLVSQVFGSWEALMPFVVVTPEGVHNMWHHVCNPAPLAPGGGREGEVGEAFDDHQHLLYLQ